MDAILRRCWCTLDREKLRDLQARRLRHFLRDAVVPFSAHYRQLFAEHGLSPDALRSLEDLEKIPFSSKNDLLPTPEQPKRSLEFVLRPEPAVLRRRPSTIVRALARGPARVRDELEREWRPVFLTSTTGRTAEPVPFLYTQYDLANLRVGGGRIVELGRCTSDERLVNLFPYAPHLAYWLVHHACLEKNLFTFGTGGGRVLGTSGNVRAIERLRPSLLVGMPTFLYHVLREALEDGRHFEGVRLLVLGGEKAPTGMRRKLAALCAELGSPGVEVLTTYGFTEAKMAWCECTRPPDEEPTGYHLYPDLGVVEIVDPETGRVVPDDHAGEIVYTPLDARGTVVLRYRTGDLIDGGLTYEPCPACGRRMPRLMGRISRRSEVRTVQLEKIKGTTIDFNEVEHLLDNMLELGAWQIELRKRRDDPLEVDEIVIHACAPGGASAAVLEERIRREFTAAFEVRPNAIEFHPCDEIRRRQKVGEALKEEKFIDRRPKTPAEIPRQPRATPISPPPVTRMTTPASTAVPLPRQP